MVLYLHYIIACIEIFLLYYPQEVQEFLSNQIYPLFIIAHQVCQQQELSRIYDWLSCSH